MDITPQVKLRPDTHYAPVAKGVYWSRPGLSFVLAGPPALYAILDDSHRLLVAGTSVDELVDAIGNEAARPVLTHVVTTLLDQGMLLDLRTAGPVPDPVTANRYAEVLAYLEAHCIRPYDVFTRLRAARVSVCGAGPALGNLTRGLADHGIDNVVTVTPDGTAIAGTDLVVLIDDLEYPIDLTGVVAPDADVPVLPIVTGAMLAVVGPVLDAAQLPAFVAAAARCADWSRVEGIGAAPRPLSAVLAGALAARAVLDRLAGLDATGGAVPAGTTPAAQAAVVFDTTLQCQRLPMDLPTRQPEWSDAYTEDDLPELTPVTAATGTSADTDTPALVPAGIDPPALGDVQVGPPALGDVQAGGPARGDAEVGPPVLGDPDTDPPARGDAEAGDDPPDIDLAHQRVAWLTARWTGPARWGDDLDLPQLPIALATLQPVSAGAPTYLGWGVNRSDAGIDALLTMLRSGAARVPGEPGWVLAAGLTRRRFLADGLLRLSTPDLLTGPPDREIAKAEVGVWIIRSLWSALDDYFDTPVRLWLRESTGISWPLVTATDVDGNALTHQWGPSPAAAAHAALASVVVGCQLIEDPTVVATLDMVGTRTLRTATDASVDTCVAALTDRAGAAGAKLAARVWTHDPVGGALPCYAGWVGLR